MGIILERSFTEKSREYLVLKQQYLSSTFVASLVGYFLYGNGDKYGSFCVNMTNFPYAEVQNLTAGKSSVVVVVCSVV